MLSYSPWKHLGVLRLVFFLIANVGASKLHITGSYQWGSAVVERLKATTWSRDKMPRSVFLCERAVLLQWKPTNSRNLDWWIIRRALLVLAKSYAFEYSRNSTGQQGNEETAKPTKRRNRLCSSNCIAFTNCTSLRTQCAPTYPIYNACEWRKTRANFNSNTCTMVISNKISHPVRVTAHSARTSLRS